MGTFLIVCFGIAFVLHLIIRGEDNDSNHPE